MAVGIFRCNINIQEIRLVPSGRPSSTRGFDDLKMKPKIDHEIGGMIGFLLNISTTFVYIRG